jgi:hypothetical protein
MLCISDGQHVLIKEPWKSSSNQGGVGWRFQLRGMQLWQHSGSLLSVCVCLRACAQESPEMDGVAGASRETGSPRGAQSHP